MAAYLCIQHVNVWRGRRDWFKKNNNDLYKVNGATCRRTEMIEGETLSGAGQ